MCGISFWRSWTPADKNTAGKWLLDIIKEADKSSNAKDMHVIAVLGVSVQQDQKDGYWMKELISKLPRSDGIDNSLRYITSCEASMAGMRTQTNTHTHTHTYIHIHIHTHTQTHRHTHTHTHTHTYTHTHTHKHTHYM